MPLFEIKHLWTDDDSMIQVLFRAANDTVNSQVEFYCYPEQLVEFVSELQEFPRNLEHVVEYEYGPDENWVSHLSLKASVLESTGRSAIEVKFDHRLDPPDGAKGHFYLACYPETVNELGRRLVSWASSPEGVFEYEWTDA